MSMGVSPPVRRNRASHYASAGRPWGVQDTPSRQADPVLHFWHTRSPDHSLSNLVRHIRHERSLRRSIVAAGAVGFRW
jgi:hypothetical protein